MRGCYEKVTVWNADGDKYRRHILPVMCRMASARRGVKNGAVVPFSGFYRDPDVWNALSDSDKNIYFTFREDDLFVFGEKYDEAGDEAGSRLNDIFEKYKLRAFFIAGVEDRSRARCGKHFFVYGG